MSFPRQRFVIGSELIKAITPDEAAATAEALKEMGLYKLPYPEVDVEFPGDALVRVRPELGPSINEELTQALEPRFGGAGRVTVVGLTEDPNCRPRIIFTWTTNPKWKGADLTEYCIHGPAELCYNTRNFLIAALASRNIVKKREERNKLGKLGIGRKPHEYVTHLHIPVDMEDDREHPPQGGTKCPHLRRGHIRRQHYGPNNELIKKVWIAPVFVNADPDYVSTRKAYNFGLKGV